MSQSAAIAACQERLDRADLLRLYDEAAPLIRGLGARLLGPGGELDDLVHDVFVVACRKRGELPRAAALSFLCGTAVKVAAGMRRRAHIRRLLGLQPPAAEADYCTPERRSQAREAARVVYAVLEPIPERRRVVFILHELHGMTGEEIAEVLGCPVNTVWSRLKKVRREFKEGLAAWRERAPQPVEPDEEGMP